MAINLVVTHPFASFSIGDVISEAGAVAKWLGSHPAHVVKVAAADPEPEAAPEPPKPASTKSAPAPASDPTT